jgi:hypothetical protein
MLQEEFGHGPEPLPPLPRDAASAPRATP